MFRARATRLHRMLVPLVSGAILWSMFATAAFAADKVFSATVTPGSLVAGASYGAGLRASAKLTLTIVNESTQALMGSANVTAPPGVDVTAVDRPSPRGTATLASGDVIQLRNLDVPATNPPSSATVAISANIECGANHSDYMWTLVVKQANDFKGTRNFLTQIGSTTSSITRNCGINWSKPPRHAEKAPVAITSKIYDPAGDPVTVTVYDGAAFDVVPWWSGTIQLGKGNDPTVGDVAVLGGTTSRTLQGSSSATFAPTLNIAASGYTLTATATPLAGSPSAGTVSAAPPPDSFNIVDDAGICPPQCDAHAGQGQKTAANVTAGATGGSAGDLIILTIADPTLTLQCGTYVATSDIVSFDVTTFDGSTPSGRAKQAELILSAPFVTKSSATKYDLCYSANDPFLDKDGALVTTGLLPTCAQRSPTLPCLLDRYIDNRTGDLHMLVGAPEGDPKAYF